MVLYGSVQLVGGVVVGYFLVKSFIWFLTRFYCYNPFAKAVDFGALGKWAVVTGGTDGIGAEYARQLAQAGQHIIIVGRNGEKLNKMKSEIQNRSTKRQTEVVLIQADLSKQEDIRAASARLEILSKEKEIGILVNNAGVSYVYPEYFHTVDDNETVFNNIVNVNCAALVQLSAAVLEAMNNRNRGLIINIGSLSGLMVSPLLSVYASSKTFVDHFSRCLYYEYKSNGISIQHISPAFVSSRMSKMRESFMAPSPKKFVQSALCTATRLKSTCGYFPHELQAAIFGLIPQFIQTKILLSMYTNTRARYLKKYKKQ